MLLKLWFRFKPLLSNCPAKAYNSWKTNWGSMCPCCLTLWHSNKWMENLPYLAVDGSRNLNSRWSCCLLRLINQIHDSVWIKCEESITFLLNAWQNWRQRFENGVGCVLVGGQCKRWRVSSIRAKWHSSLLYVPKRLAEERLCYFNNLLFLDIFFLELEYCVAKGMEKNLFSASVFPLALVLSCTKLT